MVIFLLVASVFIFNSNVVNGAECEEGWRRYTPGKVCVLYSSGKMLGFHESVKYCENLDAKLAKIDSKLKNLFLNDIIGMMDTRVWMPINDLDNEGIFQYTDGEPLGAYNSDWMEDKMYFSSDPEYSCVARDYTFSEELYDFENVWSNKPCEKLYNFFCEKHDKAPSCDPGWHMTPEKDACIKVMEEKRRDFDTARKYCEHKGGFLATSVTSWNQITNIMDQTELRDHVWIGVHSPGKDGRFQYVNGSPVVGGGPFETERPKGASNNHCVTLKEGKWFHKKCSRWFHFVCQKAPN